MTKKELLSKIKADGNDEFVIGGVLGDITGCQLYEEDRKITEKGWQTKFYGVTYWYNGIADNETIDRVTITKRAFINLLKMGIPFHGPQDIIKSIIDVYRTEGGLKSRELKMREFCSSVREIIRVGTKMTSMIRDVEKEKRMTHLVYCLGMFLQFSHTYRFWVQDIAGLINKERFNLSILCGLIKLKRDFMERLQMWPPSRDKVNFLWWLLIALAVFKRKEVKEFINELDLEKVKLDESDRYFTLRRDNYNYGGKSLEVRLIEAKRVDRERNHTILEI
ncbi:MAG TPA: hypothetical protein ENH85_00535 [Candidatus Scalindua sp.]|nr:hypothetical protein [Candidatus Scalindua sp.]